MMKKLTKLWIAVFCVVLLLPGCNLQPEKQGTNAVAMLSYVYEKDGEETVSEDFEDFLANMPEDRSINAVFCLNFEEIECEAKQNPNPDATREDVDAILAQHRARQRAYHTPRNHEFITNLGFNIESEAYRVIIDAYGPFVQLSFSNLMEYAVYYELIEAAKNSDLVAWIYVGAVMEFEPTADRELHAFAPNYPMSTVLSHIGATNQTYNGAGIRVGVIEAEDVTTRASHTELNNIVIRTEPAGAPVDVTTSLTPLHAQKVIRTLCGSNGIARGVNSVYNYYAPGSLSSIDAVNWLISNSCRIVNDSGGIANAGKYHWLDAFYDFHIRFNWITIVKAAGNRGSSTDPKCTTPGVAYNVITVGASNANNKIDIDSSYGVDSALRMRKPTLVAPGAKIQTADDASGTSYAAPVAAGVIAKLMQQFSFLQAYPEVIQSMLIASATTVSGQANAWDIHAGAGRVNYAKAQSMASNYGGSISYGSRSFSRLSGSGSGVVTSFTVNIPIYAQMRVALFWHSNSRVMGYTSSPPVNIHTDYDLRIKTTGGTTLASSLSFDNIEYISYYNISYAQMVIEITQYSSSTGAYSDYGAVAWGY